MDSGHRALRKELEEIYEFRVVCESVAAELAAVEDVRAAMFGPLDAVRFELVLPSTSTHALTNATLPYLLRLADLGVAPALASDPGFAAGLNVAACQLTNEAVARDQGRPFLAPSGALEHKAPAGRKIPAVRVIS
jgi:hypothetical protein